LLFLREVQQLSELRIPFSSYYIVNSSSEEFSLLPKHFHLTPQQVALCKDIRRRGKNKVLTTSVLIQRDRGFRVQYFVPDPLLLAMFQTRTRVDFALLIDPD
jgi:hypothetical protein